MRLIYGAGLALVAACGGKADSTGDRTGRKAAAAPVESSSRGSGGATGAGGELRPGITAQPPPDRTGAPRALFIGTSLTAGLGLDDPASESWPAVVQQIADSVGVPLTMTNAGLSGETSAGALRRGDWLLREKYDVVVIETGANDGLRGVDPDATAANIRALIGKVRAASPAAKVLLAQMEAPTNMGPRYTKAFHDLFPRIARETGVTLLPFLLEGVGGVAKFNQGDGIHPTAEGARMVARNVWPGIRFTLRQR